MPGLRPLLHTVSSLEPRTQPKRTQQQVHRAWFSKSAEWCPQSSWDPKGEDIYLMEVQQCLQNPFPVVGSGLCLCVHLQSPQQARMLRLLSIVTANQSERCIDKEPDEAISIQAWVP